MSTEGFHSEHTDGKSSEIAPQELDVLYAKKLLFQSFYFSQGNSDLQSNIFKYVHGLHPDWRFDDQMAELLHDDFLRLAENYVPHTNNENIVASIETSRYHSGRFPGGVGYIAETAREEIQKLQEQLSGPKLRTRKNAQDLIHDIAERILDQDKKYLLRQDGRPRKREGDASKITPRTDPYLSHMIYYGLEGHPTSIPEFDKMFRDVKGFVRQVLHRPNERIWTPFLKKIIEVYNKTHPADHVNLDQAFLPTKLHKPQ